MSKKSILGCDKRLNMTYVITYHSQKETSEEKWKKPNSSKLTCPKRQKVENLNVQNAA